MILFNSKTKEGQFLSNFYESPIIFGKYTFRTAEGLYQALRTEYPSPKEFENLSGREAKARGKTCCMRHNWHNDKLDVMDRILRLKFDQNIELKELLLATKDEELVHYCPWGDVFWGVKELVFAPVRVFGETPSVETTTQLVGENHLGKLLMKIRDE